MSNFEPLLEVPSVSVVESTLLATYRTAIALPSDDSEASHE